MTELGSLIENRMMGSRDHRGPLVALQHHQQGGQNDLDEHQGRSGKQGACRELERWFITEHSVPGARQAGSQKEGHVIYSTERIQGWMSRG